MPHPTDHPGPRTFIRQIVLRESELPKEVAEVQQPGNPIAGDDPLLELAPDLRAALAERLGIREASQLAEVSDRQVLAAVRDIPRLSERGVANLNRWLARQRLQREPLAQSPIAAKVQADDVLLLARHDLGRAVVLALEAQKISADAFAKRCGVSRECVVRLQAGSAPATLDLALRMAAVLGLAIKLQVS